MKAIIETIANAILKSIDSNEGTFFVEVEVADNTVAEVSGRYEIDGYEENDYYNGTGAWVVTDAQVVVDDCNIFAYDENGKEIETDVKPNINEIESYIEKQLKF